MRYLLSLLLLMALDSAPRAQSATMERARKPEVAVATPEMLAYRDKIDKAILESGISIQISIATKDPPGPLPPGFRVPYPDMVFFGYIDRAVTYAIATKVLNSFADARALGFKTVEFYDKGSGGKYTFDLRKPSPTCSRDLCF
jgi:hypothetical protein